MSKSVYTSASAGTGKTTSLTEKLAEIVSTSSCCRTPRAIVTSFTKAAASELKTRTRKCLVAKQKFSELEKLDGFLISTVNGVAESLIRKYWHLLGLSPTMSVISPEDLLKLLSSMQAPKSESEWELLSNVRLLVSDKNCDLEAPVLGLVEKAVSYGLSSSKFHKDMDDCRNTANRIYKGSLVESDYRSSLSSIDRVLNGITAKGGKNSMANSHQNRLKLSQSLKNRTSFDIAWLKEYDKLSGLKDLDLVKKDIFESELVSQCLCEYVCFICDRAEKLFSEFEDQKRERRIITFSDQEIYFLRLLEDHEVARDEIRDTYTHLFVDEFQDSSALQVRIFLKLAEIIGEENCFYYGDTKQVIYSWRAADPLLTEAVSKTMVQGTALNDCYRSASAIIDFVNNFFQKDYPGLNVQSKSSSNGALEIWEDSDIASHILDLLASDKTLKPSDIAILSRGNAQLSTAAKKLADAGIPYFFEQKEPDRYSFDFEPSHETLLVTALLSLLINPSDSMHAALALELYEPGYNLNRIIEDGLSGRKGSWSTTSVVKKVLAISNRVPSLSVTEAVKYVICSTGLFEDCNRRERGSVSRNSYLEILEKAESYEQNCANARISSTIAGFVNLLLTDKRRPSGDRNGVQLSTIHSAKGLEWRVVVVLPGNADDVRSEKIFEKNIMGSVCTRQDMPPTAANLFPDMHVGFFAPKIKTSTSITSDTLVDSYFTDVKNQIIAENKRLLYVAFTRPKDRLVLVNKDNMDYFDKVIGFPYDYSADGFVCPGVSGCPYSPSYPIPHPGSATQPDCDIRDYSPSETSSLKSMYYGKFSDAVVFCEGESVRMLPKTVSDANVGNCLHHLFAIPGLWLDNNDQIRSIAGQYGVSFEKPDLVSSAWHRLVSFLEKEFGKAESVYHELPFKFMDTDGHILTGDIDLVWKTSNGVVIVDYKTFSGDESFLVGHSRQAHYDTQLACYKAALESASETVLATYLYYPVLQGLVECNHR